METSPNISPFHLTERPLLSVIVSAVAEVREINLLSSLHLHNTSFSGLDQQPGPHSPQPAAAFTGGYFQTRSEVHDMLLTPQLKASKAPH